MVWPANTQLRLILRLPLQEVKRGGSGGLILASRGHALAGDQIARAIVGDGQWIAVLPVAKHELTLVVGAPEAVGIVGPHERGASS